MGNQLIIESIEVHQYQWEVSDLATDDYYNGFNTVRAGNEVEATGNILRIITDQGIIGEFVGGTRSDYVQLGMFLHYLIGKVNSGLWLATRSVNICCGLRLRMVMLYLLAGSEVETPLR